jgi:hypothetical protein
LFLLLLLLPCVLCVCVLCFLTMEPISGFREKFKTCIPHDGNLQEITVVVDIAKRSAGSSTYTYKFMKFYFINLVYVCLICYPSIHNLYDISVLLHEL